jgi:hypothetical protein
MNDGKTIALVSVLILHYILVFVIGIGVCGWGFLEAIAAGTFFIIVTTAAIGAHLVGPAVIVCILLAAFDCFSVYYILHLATAAGVSSCLLSEG